MGSRASHVNVYPFVWNDFRKFGYVTGKNLFFYLKIYYQQFGDYVIYAVVFFFLTKAFMEDCPNAGIFTYRLKGFHTQPTDHYMRTWYIDAVDTFNEHKPYCMGSKPRHDVSRFTLFCILQN